MFNIVKSPVQGKCAARRCKGSQHAWLEHEGVSLCHRHHAEWIEAGSPELKGSALAVGPVPVDDGVESKLTAERDEVTQAITLVRGLPVDTQDQIDVVQSVRQQARSRASELESERRTVTDPINAALKRVNSWFKPVIEGYKDVERGANARLLEAESKANAAREKALQAIEAQGGSVDDTTFLPAHRAPEVELGPGVGRDLPAFEIVDEDQVHRQLCSPDPKKIRSIAKQVIEEEGECVKGGIRWFWKKSGA